jgi:tRNA-dihydrouridine synthase C
MLSAAKPALVLAPMEGVTDAPMRAFVGELGAFTYSVSEFLRVSQAAPPRSVFLRHIPELAGGAMTPTGLPVQVQLLGGDAGRMAEAAVTAYAAGATAIDINFGCPAKTVNRHDGGATLLKYPRRIREIVAAVRSALPSTVPVSAKMRLGWDSTEPILENASMAAEGGASWITIHGRTRMACYAPPIYWPPIGRVREELSIPVVANGDIFSIEDFRRCREETGCGHFMLGRGALASPSLALQVAAELGLRPLDYKEVCPDDWPCLLQRLVDWSRHYGHATSEQTARRLKQWLRLAAVHGTFDGFDRVKTATTIEALMEALPASVGSVGAGSSHLHHSGWTTKAS